MQHLLYPDTGQALVAKQKVDTILQLMVSGVVFSHHTTVISILIVHTYRKLTQDVVTIMCRRTQILLYQYLEVRYDLLTSINSLGANTHQNAAKHKLTIAAAVCSGRLPPSGRTPSLLLPTQHRYIDTTQYVYLALFCFQCCVWGRGRY